MRNIVSILICLMTVAQVSAQEDPMYRMEIGVGGGMVNYLGDFNGNVTKDMQPMGSIVFRRNFNPFIGIEANLGYGKLKGSSADVETYYPDYAETPYEFDNTVVDLSVVFAYNFWPYGTGRDYRGAKRLTPFIYGGLGGTYVKGDPDNTFTANLPIGLGLKYKLAQRVNLSLQWTMHFSLSDKLDNIEDPYFVKSSGIFKNTDCYSVLQLTLTYSFSEKCSTCNKDY